MKKIILICLLCPMIVLAQKEIKPSVSKAEAALQKGAFDEAKAIIDATVTNQEYMLDKKGNPSKNASKAWYLKGLIYTGIDTTKVEKFKSLDPDPFKVAKEAFTKAEEIDKGKNESLVNTVYPGTQLPIPMKKTDVNLYLAQKYLDKAVNSHKAKDYKGALSQIEKTLFFAPNDTTSLLYGGAYFAPAAGDNEKAILYINRYVDAKGKNPDALLQLYNICMQKKDYDCALKAAKQLSEANPNNLDYLNSEYNVYVQTNRLSDAKALMKKRADGDPNDIESRYFLALISKKMGDAADSRHWILEILKINPDHFEANEEMSVLLNQEARALNDQRNVTKEAKKRQELFNERIAKFKEALPYAEKCVSVKPNDENSLYSLFSLYENLSLYDELYSKKSAELKKKMKAQGLQVD